MSWNLKTEAGDVVWSGTEPCVYSTEQRSWVSGRLAFPDPGHALVLDDWPAAIARLVAEIDADVDEIYRLAIGLRQAEYEAAERQAQAFTDAGYEGAVPSMVQSWAIAKGWPAVAAANDILAVSAQWRGAQEQIRAQRLLRKEQARSALGPAGLAGVRATWAAFVVAVRAQLGVGGG